MVSFWPPKWCQKLSKFGIKTSLGAKGPQGSSHGWPRSLQGSPRSSKRFPQGPPGTSFCTFWVSFWQPLTSIWESRQPKPQNRSCFFLIVVGCILRCKMLAKNSKSVPYKPLLSQSGVLPSLKTTLWRTPPPRVFSHSNWALKWNLSEPARTNSNFDHPNVDDSSGP